MKNLCFLLWLCASSVSAQKMILSPQAQINVVTIGPYQGELYSAFGHSGIRVFDPANRLNAFFNYGVFDFDQPYFYLDFARGYLNYRLAVSDYQAHKNFYTSQNRYIHEQVLNLTREQKQEFFDFLVWNAQPENMHYYYDYFYDNCATRIRDAVKITFGDQVHFDGSYVVTDYTIRDLTDLYLQQQPWGDLGIDICLGLPMDKKASPEMYMFLPDYIEEGFNHATIKHGDQTVPLVKRTLEVNEATTEASSTHFFKPTYVFTILAISILIITFIEVNKGMYFKWMDFGIFGVIGLLGWLLLILWLATDHKAAAKNMNLFWAIPFHLPVAFFLIKSGLPNWIKSYFQVNIALQIALLVAWVWLPQDLHNSLIPIVIILTIRSIRITFLKNYFGSVSLAG